MISMTGSGSGRVQNDLGQATVHITAVNNKNCRVSVRGDVRDPALEDALRRHVQERLIRGSINVQVALEPATSHSIDRDQLIIAYYAIKTIATQAGAPNPTLADAMRFVGSSSGTEAEASVAWRPVVEQALAQALQACETMRAKEGKALAVAFAQHHQQLMELQVRFRELADGRPAAYAERLRERLAAILEDRADITPEHLVRELAIYADKIDVTEELVRLESHLNQLADVLNSSEPSIGKRIEFLLQEIGREINTTGAKANDATLQTAVIDAKQIVEAMKEQAANVL